MGVVRDVGNSLLIAPFHDRERAQRTFQSHL